MGNYDFQNDFQNDAARKNYDAAMNGRSRKGVDFFEKPHLWDEERPCDIKDTPRENFVPIPVPGSAGLFAGQSVKRKILTAVGVVLLLGFMTYCLVGLGMQEGNLLGFGDASGIGFW